MMNILVTGAASELAVNLIDKLIYWNHRVVALDNLSSGKIEDINKYCRLYVDNTNSDLSNLFEKEKFDVVYHLINVGGTNIINNCIKYDVKKIILLDDLLINLLSGKIDYFILKYSYIYGLKNNIISQLIEKLKANETIQLANESADYIYIDDVVSALINGLYPIKGIYNICTNKQTTTFELINKILAKIDSKSKVILNPYEIKIGEVLSSEKLIQTGWRAFVSLDDGINKLLENK